MKLTHLAMVTGNNRRLARFYNVVFGMDEVWNPKQNAHAEGYHAFYIGDGHFQINCLNQQGFAGRLKVLPAIEINHFGFEVENCDAVKQTLAALAPDTK